MNRIKNNLLLEMSMIIVSYGILLQLAGIAFVKRKLYYSSGLWIGIMLAVFMLVYMYRTLDAGLGIGEQGAQRYVLTHSIIRYVAVVAVYGIVILYELGNPLSCFAGIMGLKAAAYLQPFVHGLLEGKKKKTECKEVDV